MMIAHACRCPAARGETAREFLACVTCVRLIGVGLLQPSAFPHDHQNGAAR